MGLVDKFHLAVFLLPQKLNFVMVLFQSKINNKFPEIFTYWKFLKFLMDRRAHFSKNQVLILSLIRNTFQLALKEQKIAYKRICHLGLKYMNFILCNVNPHKKSLRSSKLFFICIKWAVGNILDCTTTKQKIFNNFKFKLQQFKRS